MPVWFKQPTNVTVHMTDRLVTVPEEKLDLVSVCPTCGWSPSFDPRWAIPRAHSFRYSYKARKSIIVTHRPWCAGKDTLRLFGEEREVNKLSHKARRMRKLTDAERAMVVLGGLEALRDKYEARWRT